MSKDIVSKKNTTTEYKTLILHTKWLGKRCIISKLGEQINRIQVIWLRNCNTSEERL